MLVLGIETSCDDTGAALFDSDDGLLSHALYSQISLHQRFGGVVPELAARDHIRKLSPLIENVLAQAGKQVANLGGVAYTAGPGLAGALLVGASVGRALAWALDIPAVGIHHMEAHLLTPMLEPHAPEFPFVALLVSGGHTMLVDVQGVGNYDLLGESLDDAVGEAFDKAAKVLGLGYPGGPAIAQAALQGDPGKLRFPRPMTDRPGLDFSFSGLKTFTLNTAKAHNLKDAQAVADIACAFQDAAVDTLVIKCRRALAQTGRDALVVAGGVGANQHLRQRLTEWSRDAEVSVFYPRPEFCTDNGAMVAYAGWLRLQGGERQGQGFQVYPRWSLLDLPPVNLSL